MHRPFLSCYRIAINDVPISERFDFVLRDIVVAQRRTIRSYNRDVADLAGRVVSGFDRRKYRRSLVLVIFQSN